MCDSFSLDVSLKTVIYPQKYMSAIEKILKGLRSHAITQWTKAERLLFSHHDNKAGNKCCEQTPFYRETIHFVLSLLKELYPYMPCQSVCCMLTNSTIKYTNVNEDV